MNTKEKRLSKKFYTIISIIVSIFIIGSFIGGHFLYVALTPVTIKITNKEEQTINGFGTSACWWAHKIDDDTTRQDITKKLYSTEGLGLNIYRYNIGGGYDENERTSNPWRRSESFLVYDENSNSYVYDFTRDENAQKTLFMSLSYGCIDSVVLFANSPHYSMTKSGMASGNLEDFTCNLKNDCYDDYVKYFLDITEYFLSKDVPVKFISPVNEPENSWGGDWVGQEGCHYEVNQVVKLFRLFAEEIERRNLDIKLSGAEACGIGEKAKEYYFALTSDNKIKQYLGDYSFHSYWADDIKTGRKTKKDFGKWLTNNVDGTLSISMSEWCELPCMNDTNSIESALIMARVISRDITNLKVNSWTSWVAVNQVWNEFGINRQDGMISATDDFSSYEVAKRYYSLAHFSKYIPINSKVLKCKLSRLPKEISYATFKTPENKIVLVLVNETKEQTIKLKNKFKNVTIYETTATNNNQLKHNGNYSKKITLSEKSITTIILEN